MSSSKQFCFLSCIQISQEAGHVVWYAHHFQNFSQFVVIHTVKGFGVINRAEINVFLELSCFFDDPLDVGNLISGSSAFSKSSLNIWKFLVHILLKPGLENFKYYFASVWDECNCTVVWTFFGIAFLWNWNENWPFPVLWPLLSFPDLLAYWVQHFHSIICWGHYAMWSKSVRERLILLRTHLYVESTKKKKNNTTQQQQPTNKLRTESRTVVAREMGRKVWWWWRVQTST